MEPISDPVLPDMGVLKTLEEQLLSFKDMTNLALYRLDTINTLIEQEKFEFSETKIRVGGRRAAAVHKLLEELGLDEEGLTMGVFLKELNSYLVRSGLVDLNDLQIILNQPVAAAFHKCLAMKKIPYALLLRSLPTMFV